MRKLALAFSFGLVALLVSAPLMAHHGEANYDTDNVVSVKGTVSDLNLSTLTH